MFTLKSLSGDSQFDFCFLGTLPIPIALSWSGVYCSCTLHMYSFCVWVQISRTACVHLISLENDFGYSSTVSEIRGQSLYHYNALYVVLSDPTLVLHPRISQGLVEDKAAPSPCSHSSSLFPSPPPPPPTHTHTHTHTHNTHTHTLTLTLKGSHP